MFLDNIIAYNSDTGVILGTTSEGNLVLDNKLVCNIPRNIEDRGVENNLINNLDKPCELCQSPIEVCNHCQRKK